MTSIEHCARIDGVKYVHLRGFGDERGRFMETFRREWFPERSWDMIQTNRSDSVAGVLRGLHYHFNQVDYWYVPRGRIQVGLADLRMGSPTFGVSHVLEIGEENEIGVYIPSGVAHGFLALTDVTLTYLVDQYYNSDDERGVAWDDPELAVAWANRKVILSERDEMNPRLSDISMDDLPQHNSLIGASVTP